MTDQEKRVVDAVGALTDAWISSAAAMNAELQYLTLLTQLSSQLGPLSPEAAAAAAAYHVSAEQRSAALRLHEVASAELLQALEELRRGAEKPH